MIVKNIVKATDNTDRSLFFSDLNLKIRDVRTGVVYRECITPLDVDISSFEETEESFNEEI